MFLATTVSNLGDGLSALALGRTSRLYADDVGGLKITHPASPVSPLAVPAPRKIENGRGLVFMAMGMFLFAAVDTGAKFLTENLHPLQIVWARQLGLLAAASLFLLRYGPSLLKTAHPRLQVLRGGVAVCSASLFIFAVSYVPLADAMAISFVAPFMVTLMAAFVLKEAVGLRRWVAVALGFIGALIVIRPGLGVMHPAAGLVLLAAFFIAIRQIISRALSDTDRTATTVVYTAFIGSAILTLPLPFIWHTPTGTEITIMIAIAAIAAIAEICVIKALELAMAVVVAPVQYSLILWGTGYGWLIFNELPDLWTWVGTALIVATGIYTLRREYMASRQKP